MEKSKEGYVVWLAVAYPPGGHRTYDLSVHKESLSQADCRSFNNHAVHWKPNDLICPNYLSFLQLLLQPIKCHRPLCLMEPDSCYYDPDTSICDGLLRPQYVS